MSNYYKLENDSAVLENNKNMAEKVSQQILLLTQKSDELWNKYGEKSSDGHLVMKSDEMSKIVLDLQKEIDDANLLRLKYLLSGNVVWQGFEAHENN